MRRVLFAALIAACAAAASVSRASAHTEIVDSTPQDGSAVAAPPPHIELDFTRKIEPVLALLNLSDAEGHDTPVLDKTVDAARPTVLIVTVPRLSDGTYRLRYNILDAVDLHRTVGSIVFGVGGRAVLAPEGSTSVGPGGTESTLRFATITGLSTILGVLAFLFVVAPRVGGDVARVRRRLVTLALGAAAVMIAAAGGTLAVSASTLPAGTGIDKLLTGTDFGRWWSASAVAVGLLTLTLAASLWWLRQTPARSRRASAALVTAAVIAVCSAVTVAAVGHNGDATSASAPGTVLRTVHLVSVGAWAGGLGVLLTVLLGLRGAARAAERRAVLTAFSPLAAVSFVIAVASGLALAGVQVQTVTALFATLYGTELIVKVSIVACVAALALWHSSALWRRQPRRGARRRADVRLTTLAVECAGAVAIVGLAVILGGTPPARGAAFDPPPPAPADTVSVTPEDLLVHVALRPNLPGTNILEVRAVSRRRPAPGPVQSIRVTLGGPATTPAVVDLGPVDAGGTASRSVTLESPGSLSIDVSVIRGAVPAVATRLDWTVGAPQVPRHPSVVSTMAVAPLAFVAAGAVLCAGAGVAVILWARRRSMKPPSPVALDGVAG